MDCKTIVDLLLTLAIAAFAFGTWRATRSYARLIGLSLFLEHLRGTKAADPGDRKTSIEALKLVRVEFPDIFETMKPRINPDIAREIEE